MIIGMIGRARSGKSSAVTEIEKYATDRGLSVAVYDIGDMVRRYCISQGLLVDKPRAALNKEDLAVLVDVGKRQRDTDENFWVDQMTTAIAKEMPDVALIPNIRYPNEIDVVKTDGYLVKVKALNPDGSEFISTDRDPNHISETALLGVPADFYITANRGDSALVGEMAITIFEYVLGLRGVE